MPPAPGKGITAATLLLGAYFCRRVKWQYRCDRLTAADGWCAGSVHRLLGIGPAYTPKRVRVCGLNLARPPKQLCEIQLKTPTDSSGHSIHSGIIFCCSAATTWSLFSNIIFIGFVAVFHCAVLSYSARRIRLSTQQHSIHGETS